MIFQNDGKLPATNHACVFRAGLQWYTSPMAATELHRHSDYPRTASSAALLKDALKYERRT